MRSIQVVRLPGGITDVEYAPGTTLAQLAERQGLAQHTLTVDGTSVPKGQWNAFKLDGHNKVYATREVKGA